MLGEWFLRKLRYSFEERCSEIARWACTGKLRGNNLEGCLFRPRYGL